MSFDEPVAHLPDGSSLAYLDSLPVPGSQTFTTFVIWHGLCFNSYTFEDLLALAPHYDLRLIIVQRKDYRGSSLYTEEEMDLLSNDPKTFLERLGKTTLQFIEYTITHTSISPLSQNSAKATGGISMLGWSLGCLQAMSAFSTSLMRSERKTYERVEPYLQNLILYDPPQAAMGVTLPCSVKLYFPFWTDDPLEQQIKNFKKWVSSYFDHPKHWNGNVNELDGRKCSENTSIQMWSEDTLERRTEEFAIRSDGILLSDSTIPYIESMVDDVVFNHNTSSMAFPRVKIDYISLHDSVWICVYTAHATRQKYYSMNIGHNRAFRPMTFKEGSKLNHLVHCDFPEEFLAILLN